MKKTVISLTALALFATLQATSLPGHAATEDITINAAIIAAVALAQDTSMNFGTIDPGTGGTAVLTPNGTIMENGDIAHFGGVVSPGILEIQASPGTTVSISMPASETISNGTDTMTVSNFNIDGSGANATTLVMGAATESVPIGATLNVGNGQAAGNYTGTVSVTVDYQ